MGTEGLGVPAGQEAAEPVVVTWEMPVALDIQRDAAGPADSAGHQPHRSKAGSAGTPAPGPHLGKDP